MTMKRGYQIVRKDKAGLEPVKSPTPIDIAWAAGIFEGEGSCQRSGHGLKSFTMQISQKDPEILYRLRDLFGGGVKQYHVGNERRFEVYHWTCCGNRGRVFLASIFNLLSARRKAQIERSCVKEFLDTVPDLIAQEQRSDPCLVYAKLWDSIQAYVEQQRFKAKEHTRQRMAEFDRQRRLDPVKVARRQTLRRAKRQMKKAQIDNSALAPNSRLFEDNSLQIEVSYLSERTGDK